MGTQVVVPELPPCDFCARMGVARPARYDGATRIGPWANMCEAHFRQYGVGLGTGRGQKLVLKSELSGLCGFSDDPTESIRRRLVAEINADPGSRAALEAEYGQVWDTSELSRDFVVMGFMAPFVVVRRKSDGAVGSLMFQHHPRFYYGFTPDRR